MTKFKFKKILLLGSGALKIGQAGEFDYSGSQAIKALREEGIKTVLLNPNIATVQTSEGMADEIYFLPITPYFAEKVIAKEKPDGILLSFGGQTALNCGLELEAKGVFKKYNVKVLGTPTRAIKLTEDRQDFADHLRRMNISVPESQAVKSLAHAILAAKQIGYPVMVRAAYSLGGQKSGMARNQKQLEELAKGALAVSPQILVEQYLTHYKEIEYEVVRDRYGNSVTICNMENMDPLGIHTGESIVVAPSQTLNNFEYHELRKISMQIVESLGIIGECNVQFALNPKPLALSHNLDYQVIEVNARLSRSSALASKATGYPLAYVAAKLALGKSLSEVKNQVTKITQSFFEPAMDYVAVKLPRWDLDKFNKAEEKIGSAMKSVGEVMAIGRSFEEALQKAARMLNGKNLGITDAIGKMEPKKIKELLKAPTSRRLFAIAAAFAQGLSVSKIHAMTGIDPWFLHRVANIAFLYKQFSQNPSLTKEALLRLKQAGFSDLQIGLMANKTEAEIRKIRLGLHIIPAIFQIDTLSGEVPAKTNYLYLTYHGSHNDVMPLGKKAVLVLGSGPYHIGSSVEFDWSCVNTAKAFHSRGKKSIIVNCNPETVSTDYDMSDRLYFEDLSLETILDILDFEKAEGAVISVGGQRPNNLAGDLHKNGIKLFGTSAANIDRAEDRNKFSALLDKLNIPQPAWKSFTPTPESPRLLPGDDDILKSECLQAKDCRSLKRSPRTLRPGSVTSLEQAQKFAEKVKYPVLVRPSYVLSGSAMSICYNREQLRIFLEKASGLNSKHPVTISKFISGAHEIEIDAVAQNGKVLIRALSEHVENAGVHSGDATIVFPAQKVYTSTEHQIFNITNALAKELKITGPFNVQFLVKDNRAFVIECNLRASRTLPLLSKALRVNFPALAVDSFFGKGKAREVAYPERVVVKSPQFSFARLLGADPLLRVEMSSTGEVACFGDEFYEALYKSVLSVSDFQASKRILLSLGGPINKKRFLDVALALFEAGYEIFATDSTSEYLESFGITTAIVRKVSQSGKKNVLDLINNKEVDFVVNLTERNGRVEEGFARHISDGYRIRRATVDNHIPLFTDFHLARSFVKALLRYNVDELTTKSYREYF